MYLHNVISLKQIDENRLNELRQYAIYEHENYLVKIRNKKLICYTNLKHDLRFNSTNRVFEPLNKTIYGIQNYMYSKVNIKDYKISNETEKNYFLCNSIFPNDEQFLNLLVQKNFLNIFNEFLTTYTFIEEKYHDNPKLEFMQKFMQIEKLIKKHNDEIVDCYKYFHKFHGINNLEIILNKLLQIYSLNFKLYNSYIDNETSKRLVNILN